MLHNSSNSKLFDLNRKSRIISQTTSTAVNCVKKRTSKDRKLQINNVNRQHRPINVNQFFSASSLNSQTHGRTDSGTCTFCYCLTESSKVLQIGLVKKEHQDAILIYQRYFCNTSQTLKCNITEIYERLPQAKRVSFHQTNFHCILFFFA